MPQISQPNLPRALARLLQLSTAIYSLKFSKASLGDHPHAESTYAGFNRDWLCDFVS